MKTVMVAPSASRVLCFFFVEAIGEFQILLGA